MSSGVASGAEVSPAEPPAFGVAASFEGGPGVPCELFTIGVDGGDALVFGP